MSSSLDRYWEDYERDYEARREEESKSARMIVDYDADLLKTTYEEGLNDAWEMARKIRLYPSDGGISIEDLGKIFGNQTHYDILRDYSAQEAIEKIKAWEDKNEIKVGDEVVYSDGIKGIVVGISNNAGQISVLNNEYDVPQLLIKNNATKTGRHFDQIEEVLKQMQRSGE